MSNSSNETSQNIEAVEAKAVTEQNEGSSSKKGKSTNKKRIIVILSLVAAFIVVVLAITLTLVFVLRPQKKVEVQVRYSGQSVFVESTPNSEGLKYRFKFKFGEKEIELNSDSHILDITSMLWSGEIPLGEEVKIGVCYVNADGVLSGEYGKELSFTFTLILSSPVVNYDGGSTISWSEVKGADEYNICDSSDNLLAKTQATTFDLSSVAGGEREIYVVATSKNDFMKDSNPSNFISTKIIHQISHLTSAVIDGNNLVVIADEMLKGLEVTDITTNKQYLFSLTSLTQIEMEDGKIKITCPLNVDNLSSKSLSVKPLTDEFNLYAFEPTQVEHN